MKISIINNINKPTIIDNTINNLANIDNVMNNALGKFAKTDRITETINNPNPEYVTIEKN